MEAKTFGKKTTPTQILDSPQINKSESEKSNREIPKEKTQPPSNQKEPNQKKSSGYGQAPIKKTATKEEVKKKSETETRPSGNRGATGGTNRGNYVRQTGTNPSPNQNKQRRGGNPDDSDGDDAEYVNSDDSDVDIPGDFDDEAPEDKAFKRVSQGLRRIDIEYEEMEFVDDYLHALGKTVCSFCTGRGHLPDTCASKKNLDILMRETGNAEDWGKLKNRRYGVKFRAKREAKKRFTRNN